MKNDRRSKFSNLSNWKEEAWKNQGLNGIQTRDLRDKAPGGGGTPKKIGSGCAARFPRPLPYLWPKPAIFPTLFMTWRLNQSPVSDQAPVVRNVDNHIHLINHYPADSVVCFVNIYPLDSVLSSG